MSSRNVYLSPAERAAAPLDRISDLLQRECVQANAA